MSAIAGVVGPDSKSERELLVRQLLFEQRLYGSDRNDILSLDGATFGISSWRAFTAATPAASGPLVIVADLKLDNRNDLIERLGESLRSASDSELLLAAWAKAGEQCLGWIAGDFALALFDVRTGALTLARDPSGQMPLHYAQVGEAFAFASMPTGLRPILGGLSIDREAVAATLCDLRDDDPRSHFETVSRVMPGEVVRLRLHSIDRHIYWHPATAWNDPLKDVDLIEGYRHALDTAVRDSLNESARPLATHLSSGYDSSAVTATAARLLPHPDRLIAFTSAPGSAAPIPGRMWRIADESGIAAQTAASLGIRHVIVRDVPPIRETIRHLIALRQEVVIAVPNVAWLLQIRREAAAAGANCLLSGASGNITSNAGGIYMLTDWLRRGQWLTWARQARLAAARPDTRWRGVLFNSFRPWIPKFTSDMLRRHYLGAGPIDGVTFLRPEWTAKAFSAAPPWPRHRNSYEERIHIVRNDNVGLTRKAALAGEGVDERDPLADRRLIEFCLRIPQQHLYWNGIMRPLAQAALADRVPKEVLDLKVRGLQSADWAMRFKPAEAHEMLDEVSASATACELLDLPRMREAIAEWPVEDWNEPSPHYTYRVALLGALSAGMFALLHEESASQCTST